jgi:hypothetical protein
MRLSPLAKCRIGLCLDLRMAFQRVALAGIPWHLRAGLKRLRLGLKELSNGIARQPDQSEYSKDGAYRHVHAIDARRDQAECVLFPPLDAAAGVSGHRRQSPAEQDDGASDRTTIRPNIRAGACLTSPGRQCRRIGRDDDCQGTRRRRVVICRAPFLSPSGFSVF